MTQEEHKQRLRYDLLLQKGAALMWVLGVALIAGLTALGWRGFTFAERLEEQDAVLADEERCYALHTSSKNIGLRCVFEVGHRGPHHTFEDANYFAHWWKNDADS